MHYQLRHAITLQTVIHIWLGSSEYILSSMVEISSTLSNFPLKYKKELYGMFPFKISENNHFRKFNLKNGINYKSIEQRKSPIQHLIINITNPPWKPISYLALPNTAKNKQGILIRPLNSQIATKPLNS